MLPLCNITINVDKECQDFAFSLLIVSDNHKRRRLFGNALWSVAAFDGGFRIAMTSWSNRISSLFQAHRAQLESMVRRRVGNVDTAADLVQDVFLRVMMAGPRETERDDQRVLFASARNAATEHLRSRLRRSDIMASLVPEQLAAAPISPQATLEAREAISALDEALAQLSPRCREIFIRRRVEGLSNEEIARRYGISINSVEKHIARALRHCQTSLADHLRES
jgi:RNA polymerase sigma factor (sigma-70 family)